MPVLGFMDSMSRRAGSKTTYRYIAASILMVGSWFCLGWWVCKLAADFCGGRARRTFRELARKWSSSSYDYAARLNRRCLSFIFSLQMRDALLRQA